MKCITAKQITKAIRIACIVAYTYPNHSIHKLLLAFSSHLGRVFACLTLHQSGLHKETIAYHFYWHKHTVEKHIRGSSSDIESYTAAKIAGIYISSSSPTK